MERKLLDQLQDGDPIAVALRGGAGWIRGTVIWRREDVMLLRATGGTMPYRWARVGGTLPPGVRLAVTGRVSGVPVRAGRFTLRARVADRTGATRARVFSLRIA